jgi:tRNA threonylcarbamoyladenosine biosynthesis protein TsaE
MQHNITSHLNDEVQTLAFGARFAAYLSPGLVIYLHGDLGAGKTTFVRGLLQGLGHQGKVKSPTYTLVEPYDFFNYTIYHFDLYRFTSEEEWEAAGFRENFNPQSICIIEWPEKASGILPIADIDIHLTIDGIGRQVQIMDRTHKHLADLDWENLNLGKVGLAD